MKGVGFQAVIPEMEILLLFFVGIIGIITAVIAVKAY